MKRLAALFALLVLLAACATQDARYPSLAKRAAESQGFAEPEAPPPAPLVADPALDARIATANTALADTTKRFDLAASRTEALARAARGDAAGSDRWLDAQTALADLDAIRADTSAALTNLEEMASARAQALLPAYPTLDAAIASNQTRAQTQADRITAIQAMLPPA